MTAATTIIDAVRIAAAAADRVKANDIVAFDVTDLLAFTEVMMIASASNERQVLAIAEELNFLILPLGHGAQVRPRAARGFADERSHSSMVQRFDHRRAEPGVPRERL